MNEARIPGHPSAPAATGWSAARWHVQLHFERHGMTPLQAERFSHEVIVRCAGELESGDGGRVQERAMAEAETMLVGWRSARRTPLAAAA